MTTKIKGSQIKDSIAGAGLTLSAGILNINVDGTTLRVNGDLLEVVSSGLSLSLTDLDDAPSSYFGEANKYLVVNGTETGIGFITLSGGEGVDHSVLSNLSYLNSGHTGFISTSQLTTTSGDIISYVNLRDVWEIVGGEIRPKTTYMGDPLYTSGNVTIGGNLTVTGTVFYNEVENVLVSDNLIHINYGESGAGVTQVIAGIQIDRGSAEDYFFVFDERNNTFRLGISGTQDSFNDYSLQPVATREDLPTNNRVAWWDTASNTLRTHGDAYITISSGTDAVNIAVNNNVETTVTTSGIKLRNSQVSINEILNTLDSDSINHTSTDAQIASAKLVYNYVNSVSGSIILNHNNLQGLQGGTSSQYYHLTSADYSALTIGLSETIEDVVGGMLSGTQTNITVSYNDASGDLNFVVPTATTSGIGTAQFSSSNFSITSGVVSVVDNGINETELLIANSPINNYYLKYTTASGMLWADVSSSGVVESAYQLENESVNCDGNNLSFTLSYVPIINSLQVYLNGLFQEKGPGKDYENSNTTVTFAVAPLAGDVLVIHYIRSTA